MQMVNLVRLALIPVNCTSGTGLVVCTGFYAEPPPNRFKRRPQVPAWSTTTGTV